jgi:hypothetical protein
MTVPSSAAQKRGHRQEITDTIIRMLVEGTGRLAKALIGCCANARVGLRWLHTARP